MTYADVAVDFPDDRARLFTYAVPVGMEVVAGDLVRVPFGAQELQGVVFGTGGAAPETEARPIAGRIEGGPFISPERLEAARWIAGHYRTTYYVAASVFMPAGAVTRLRTWLKRAKELPAPVETLTPGEARALSLAGDGGPVRKDRLVRRLGTGGAGIVERLIRRGFFATSARIEEPTKPKYEDRVVLAAPAAQALEEASKLRGTRRGRRAELLDWLAAGNPAEARAALAGRFGAAAVAGVIRDGLARLERARVYRDPLAEYSFQQQFAPDPTPEQASAVDAITHALAAARPGQQVSSFLLFGVTGSGKTEVYMRAVEACLRQGRGAIVLVPEIGLTPQTLRRFGSRFPGKVALQHSGLTEGQRYDQWWQVKEGVFPIVLGSRSAVFSPVRDLGLIVIDEEHEWTYKQPDLAPRYHARDVAERLCGAAGGVLVLGSATPDLGTFRRAERGEHRLLRLPYRLAASAEPLTGPASGHATAAPAPAVTDREDFPGMAPRRTRVEVVDMREELRAGHVEVLSRRLIEALREALAARGRVILFINRRGVASFIQCRRCGAIRRCRRCDTSLVYHRGDRRAGPGQLVCHYCGYRVPAGRACPDCGGAQMLRLGPGTQAVADAVQSYFPRAGVARWDSDTARTASEHAEILERFERGDSRVLVGTQLVAKGLDIPSVTLVGVVAADVGLSIPDFRAAERTFQLMAQAAGRAGRGLRPGLVVVQTFQPEHYAIRAAASEDYESFYRQEVEVRSRFGFPPFTRLIRLLYSDPDAAEANRAARELAAALRRERVASGETGAEVSGPSPAFPHRLRGRWRWQIALRGHEPGRLLDRVRPGRGWVVDVDPVSLA